MRSAESGNGNPEIVQMSINMSLKCPITMKRIDLPARGQECRHPQVRFLFFIPIATCSENAFFSVSTYDLIWRSIRNGARGFVQFASKTL